MDPIEWMNQHIPGFAQLRPEERQAIEHFTLLWSLFEANCLQTRGSSDAIDQLVRGWSADDRLDAALFEQPLAYFRDRYFQNGVATHHFPFLNLAERDKPLVTGVLRGDIQDATDCTVGLLIVVYRLRNNFFHGEKWAYQLQGQQKNFTHANDTLMNAMQIQSTAVT